MTRIAERNTNITVEHGQKVLKVVLTLTARQSKDPIQEFTKWDIRFVEADGKESGSFFGWKFFDRPRSLAWVYSYPNNTGAKFIKIEGVLIPLPLQKK